MRHEASLRPRATARARFDSIEPSFSHHFSALPMSAICKVVMGLRPLYPVHFRQLEMRQQASAHFRDWKQPEIFGFTSTIQMS